MNFVPGVPKSHGTVSLASQESQESHGTVPLASLESQESHGTVLLAIKESQESHVSKFVSSPGSRANYWKSGSFSSSHIDSCG